MVDGRDVDLVQERLADMVKEAGRALSAVVVWTDEMRDAYAPRGGGLRSILDAGAVDWPATYLTLQSEVAAGLVASGWESHRAVIQAQTLFPVP